MKKFIYPILTGFAIVFVVFSLQWLGIVNYRFFEPKRENARREVYENTQSYVEGKRQAITKYYDEWRKADADNKAAIRMIVLQDFANFDTEHFTSTQFSWYNQIIN